MNAHSTPEGGIDVIAPHRTDAQHLPPATQLITGKRRWKRWSLDWSLCGSREFCVVLENSAERLQDGQVGAGPGDREGAGPDPGAHSRWGVPTEMWAPPPLSLGPSGLWNGEFFAARAWEGSPASSTAKAG